MKYWKGNVGTGKEGQCGTMEDSGVVPDSIEITKVEYDAWIASLPVVESLRDKVKKAIVDNPIPESLPATPANIKAIKIRIENIEKLLGLQ